MDAYFRAFEGRTPPEPLPHSPAREVLWQVLATLALVLGARYLAWRWGHSINWDAPWLALPLIAAETLAFVGLVLFVHNLWRDEPVAIRPAPARMGEVDPAAADPDAPVAVDLFVCTYSEEPELVRLGLIDAKAMAYPHPIDLRIHVLDDGRRPAMRAVAEEEGVNYIARPTNEGFKAGNLRHAMERTSAPFLVICDADTRPLPTLLARTLGHFRDPKVAWVQTPQWFYDLPEGEPLARWLRARLGRPAGLLGGALERLVGEVRIGADPFVNDPRMFYDVILRRRNRANAAFCCGAGSIHRREAVMEAALRAFGARVEARARAAEEAVTLATRERAVDPALMGAIRADAVRDEVLTPYRFHVSEDIFTSITLHADRARGWRSVQHPFVESRMLSPQDLLAWTVQRFKYAGGSLDILLRDNPLLRPGLTLRQRLMYAATFWSYLGPLWNVVFLLAPIVSLLTGLSPVAAPTEAFLLRLVPFLAMLELAMMVGTWGVRGGPSKAAYLATFPLGLRAIGTVLRGERIGFPVTPKDRQAGRHWRLVRPQLAVIAATLGALVVALGALAVGGTPHRPAAVALNAFWGLHNCLALSGMVAAALWQPPAPSPAARPAPAPLAGVPA